MTIYLETAPRAGQPAPMTDAEWQARVQLAACYRIFDMLGWVEMIFNHITVRVPGPELRFLINPFGLHYSEITASDLLLIDIDGNPVRPAQWPVNRAGFVIHSAIHGAVPDAHCVMHTHTTTGIAVACLKEGLSPHNFYAAMLHGRVAYHDFEGITVEPGEKERLVRDLDGKPAMILQEPRPARLGPERCPRPSSCCGPCSAPATCRSPRARRARSIRSGRTCSRRPCANPVRRKSALARMSSPRCSAGSTQSIRPTVVDVYVNVT